MKRSEWLKVNDVITDEIRNGKVLKVLDIRKDGILVKELVPTTFYIGDEEDKQYFKVTNIIGEYDKQTSKLI